jgi:hypothetical protein
MRRPSARNYSTHERKTAAQRHKKPADCADAEFELGRAKMYAGDFSGALLLLKNAELNYLRAEKLDGTFHEFSMIQVKNQGQTNVLLAVALFRTGNTREAATNARRSGFPA